MAKSQNGSQAVPQSVPETSAVPSILDYMVEVFDGSFVRFGDLPRVSQENLIDKAWTRYEAERASGAYTKALTHYCERHNITTGKSKIKRETVSPDYVEDDSPYADLWEGWQNEAMYAFRDAALAGDLGSVAREGRASRSQVMREEAANRVIADLMTELNKNRTDGKVSHYFFEMKKGKGVTEENEKRRARNAEKMQKFLAGVAQGNHAEAFNRHLTAVRDEYRAKAEEAKARKAASEAVSEEEIEDLTADIASIGHDAAEQVAAQ